jgi:Transposase IS116/IS110/IS902 family
LPSSCTAVGLHVCDVMLACGDQSEDRNVTQAGDALLITAGDDNPDTEASFAALCGASPIEASSGKTRRHRLM